MNAHDQKLIDRQNQMFGTSISELDHLFPNPDTMTIMSMMSDAQEEIARGMKEEARQTLNRAKYLLQKIGD